MAKKYAEPRWMSSNMSAEIWYFPGGEAEPGTQIERKDCVAITQSALHALLPFLFEQGYLNTFLTTSSREDDLKVTHRLLDLLDTVHGLPKTEVRSEKSKSI